MDVEQHQAMAGPAQLRALAAERLAGVFLVDRDLEHVDPARHDVTFEQELGDVEGVDDVRALQAQLDRSAGRKHEAAILAGREELRVDRVLAALIEILEGPLELAGHGLDPGLRIG